MRAHFEEHSPAGDGSGRRAGAPMRAETGDARSPWRAAAGPAPIPEADALYREFRPLVERVLRTRDGADGGAASESVDAELRRRFEELLRSFDPARAPALRAYLARKLTVAAQAMRRAQFRAPCGEPEVADLGAPQPGAGPGSAGSARDADRAAELLPEVIAALPTRQRQVILWRYYEARPLEEIAALLEASPAAVRALLRRGLATMRRRLAGNPAGPGAAPADASP